MLAAYMMQSRAVVAPGVQVELRWLKLLKTRYGAGLYIDFFGYSPGGGLIGIDALI